MTLKQGLEEVGAFQASTWKYILTMIITYYQTSQSYRKTNLSIHWKDWCWSWLQFNSVQSLSHVRLFETWWTAAHQASLSITNSRSLCKRMSIDLVMLSNHLILCHPRLLPPSIFPSIRVFSNESVLCIRWPRYWSFSFSISPSNEEQTFWKRP